MGKEREKDEFYVLPTRNLRNEMRDRWEWCLGEDAQVRAPWVDAGILKLYFYPAPKAECRPGYDLAKKWERYRNNWEFTSN